MIVQDLWQVHYQILLIIFLKKFMKLNVNTGTDKNVKQVELNTKIYTNFKIDSIEQKMLNLQ